MLDPISHPLDNKFPFRPTQEHIAKMEQTAKIAKMRLEISDRIMGMSNLENHERTLDLLEQGENKQLDVNELMELSVILAMDFQDVYLLTPIDCRKIYSHIEERVRQSSELNN